MKRLSSSILLFFLTLLFYQCTDTSTNRKNIVNINEKLLSAKSYTFQNFTFNTPKGWVLMNPKDSINLVFLSPIDSSMMLVNITNKFDPSLFSKPQYAAFINNEIKFQQNVYQNSKAVIFDIKVQNNDDSLSFYFAVPRLRIEENVGNIESSIGSVRLN
tara:strand:- start:907 stop:1383 length:477 start_codon:yes stop_codon:yes gene_type:complete